MRILKRKLPETGSRPAFSMNLIRVLTLRKTVIPR